MKREIFKNEFDCNYVFCPVCGAVMETFGCCQRYCHVDFKLTAEGLKTFSKNSKETGLKEEENKT